VRNFRVLSIVLGLVVVAPLAAHATPDRGSANRMVNSPQADRLHVAQVSPERRRDATDGTRKRAGKEIVRSGSKSSLSDDDKEFIRDRIIDQQRTSTSRDLLR
jgi:hypothetical protein